MGAPPTTLLKKGSLVARMGEDQSNLDKIVPMNHIMDWISSKLDGKSVSDMSDRVMILLSKTGSGKSSSIPPNIYLRFFQRYRRQIIITQPRVLTAIEIPKDISTIAAYKVPNKNGLSIELYRNLGYQTQEFVRKPVERGILFSTTGILLQFLKTMTDAQFIKKFKFIIVDEAHDRSLDVDLVLLLMKRLIKRNMFKDPPFLILMSATLNVDEYSEYFGSKTIFEVSGQSKPIEVIYPDINVDDIYSKTCEIVLGLEQYEKTNPSDALEKGIRDVIVFMPSLAPIKRMVLSLAKLNAKLTKKILPVSITSADINGGGPNLDTILRDIKQVEVEVDGKMVPAYRRIIVSTNVAETGLTLESLRYCIDTALQFSNEFNHRYGVNVMMTKPTTSSMSLQRKGRVGRKHAGVFFPLFTEETFNAMIVDNTPSVVVEDMTSHMLTLFAAEQSTSIDKIPVYEMLSPPSDDSINYSLEQLFVLGAIDSNGVITKMGHRMNLFRKISVNSARMILAGIAHGASLHELVTLACLLTTKKNDLIVDKKVSGVAPYEVATFFTELYETHTIFSNRQCDLTNYNRLKARLLIGCEMIELVLIYQMFLSKAAVMSTKQHRSWADKKGLNYNNLCKTMEQIDEVYWQMMEQHRVNPLSSKAQGTEDIYQTLRRSEEFNTTELIDAVIKLKKCIYDGFKTNILKWNDELGVYQTLSGLHVKVNSKLVSQISYQKIGASFEQDRPRVLIYNQLLCRQDNIGKFAYEASTISVMDGFVHVDLGFASM